MNFQGIIVSIVCNTYNHERYIGNALEGFVRQKTTFDFEILVMDDASTDQTASIIRTYEKKYPNLIKAVYNKENQYSKGNLPGAQNRQRAIGKYIAICEGDDYWVDDYKLQKQVDYMEQHKGCTFCFTNADCEEGGVITRRVVPWVKSSTLTSDNVYDVEQIEKIGYIPTASFLFKREDCNKLPKLRQGAFNGDGYLKVGFTSLGYVYFLDEATCVYRYGVEGSATTSWKVDKQKRIASAEKFIKMYEDFDALFEGKYDIFKQRITEWEISKLVAQDNFKFLRQKKYFDYYKKGGFISVIKFVFMVCFPRIYKILRK